MGWVTFLIYITLIGGAVYVVYLLFRFGLAYVIRKLEGMTQD